MTVPKESPLIGHIFIQRPGKIRYDFNSIPASIIKDGNIVETDIFKNGTQEIAEAPADLLALGKLDLKLFPSASVKWEGDNSKGKYLAIDIVLIGGGKARFVFDAKKYALKQYVENGVSWTFLNTQQNAVLEKDVCAQPLFSLFAKRGYTLRAFAQSVLDQFTAPRTEKSDYKIIFPDGRIAEGVKYTKRPGISKDVAKEQPRTVITHGKDVVVITKNDSWVDTNSVGDPLTQDKIDLSSCRYVAVKFDRDNLTIKTVEMNGLIVSYVFDRKDYVLKKYIRGNGVFTFSNTQRNVVFSKDMFDIPYQKLH